MGVWSTTAKNTMLDSITTFYVSLHSADPGDTGASELSGSPYARIQATVGAAANGTRNLSSDVLLDVPGGSTVSYVGYWSAATGGTFLGKDDVDDESYTSDGQYKVLASGTTFNITDPA
jgi:hypothetical protein